MEYENARVLVPELKEFANESEDKHMKTEIRKLEQQMNKTTETEKEFSKNMFANGSLYTEKESVPTKEEEEKLKVEQDILDEVTAKQKAIDDETEYLGTLNNV
jgi:hypothetical protein